VNSLPQALGKRFSHREKNHCHTITFKIVLYAVNHLLLVKVIEYSEFLYLEKYVTGKRRKR